MNPRGLMLIHQFRPVASGAEFQAERLACKLFKLGHQMKVLTTLIDPNSAIDETINGISVHRSRKPLSYVIYGDISHQFKYLVKNRRNYDIIHSHQCFNHAVIGTVVAGWFGKKSILKIACAGDVGDLSVFSKFVGFKRALEVLHQTDMVIAVSGEVEKELCVYGFSPDKICRIPNGVDAGEFKRSKPFPNRSKVTFILIGRRTPQKGIDIALKALKLLSEKGINGKRIELKVYGWDYPEQDYYKLAGEVGVLPMVKFFPYSQTIKDVYHDAHCLLLPSRTEGLSNVLLEAMSFELPVIATRISGTVDVVDHGESGILIPPESPEALAVAMELVINNPEVSSRLGENARQRILEKFSLDEVARLYSELYHKLCAPAGKGNRDVV
ncbi:MAG: glycosyltransferase family 4 protein [Candidatus Omnitrophota bacterium]|jgi:glycosyltransferase involved in cell wall biosynthesis